MPYWLFGGSHYYASGGIRDLIAVGNNLQELMDKLTAHGFAEGSTDYWMFDEAVLDWWHIVDSRTRDVVACDPNTQQYGLHTFPDTVIDTTIVQEPHT